MAFTQADLDKVNAAIATGEEAVGIGDMRITYRGMDDLLKARSVIEADLRAQQNRGCSLGPRYLAANFSDE